MSGTTRVLRTTAAIGAGLCLIALLALAGCKPTESATEDTNPSVRVERRSFVIKISEIGVLEAKKSISVPNPVRGAQAKIVNLVPEGTRVNKGDFIAQIDITPFEERVERYQNELDETVTQQNERDESYALEKLRAEKETLAANHNILLAELELKDVVQGKGRIANIEKQSAVDEAKTRYERETQRYKDVEELFAQDFVSAYELSTQKITMDEAKSAYELAKLRHEVQKNYTYPADKAKAEAGLKKVQSELSQLEMSLQRSLARERAKVESARRNVKTARKRFDDAKQEVKDCYVTAPGSGFVIYGNIWSGGWRKLQVGDQLWRNYPIATIPDLNTMVAQARVREVDVHQVKIGQEAVVTIDAFPELKLKGKIETIGTLAVKDQETQTNEKYFNLMVKMEQSDPRFRPGMTARVEVLIGEVKDALTIPVHAIFIEDGETVCYVKTDRGIKSRVVKLGRQNENFVEVVEGLMEGDRVYLARQGTAKKRKEAQKAQEEPEKKSFNMRRGGT